MLPQTNWYKGATISYEIQVIATSHKLCTKQKSREVRGRRKESQSGGFFQKCHVALFY